MKPNEVIRLFDDYLALKNLSFSAVVIGGSALALLGIISRETQDCDVLDPSIPESIKKASKEFAKTIPSLKEDWLNNGPETLKRELPPDWMLRLSTVYQGKGITLFTLGRSDLLKSKLFAYCDRGTDLADCIALKPTKDELKDSIDWVSQRDGNVGWPKHVQKSFEQLAKKLGYEF